MSKPFLILQLRPEDITADNEFAAIKKFGQLADHETKRQRLDQHFPTLNLDNYAAIIVGGSPFDISTPRSQKSRLQRDIESGFSALFDQVVAQDFPFLGCCSGNGLLGNYCGATISRKYAEPVGGVDVNLTDEGKRDPLLQGLPETFRVLLGHKEACDALPPNCVLLATNTTCPVQMFRLKTNIYATQFHPEADAEGFTVRINAYKNFGYFAPEMAENLIQTVEKEVTPEAQSILARFVHRYRQQPV